MRGLWATLIRELRAYFLTPLGYVVLTGFLLFNGLAFLMLMAYLNDPRAPATVTPLDFFFGETIFFWLAVLFTAPVITMRLISEELRSGTIEVLMTAPVTELQVVVGKYLAALVFYAALWVPTVSYAAIVAYFVEVDWGPIAAGYLGILGIGSVFLAVGIFASALTKNQIVAAVLAFTLLFALFIPAFMEFLVNEPAAKAVVSHLNLYQHMDDFSKGLVDTRRLVFYFSTTIFFLFLTSRMLAAKKWR
jgi:ABC-2 type transport system permease protein